ncbi:hypothetical protein CYLTODRAFT_457820 [Cylindrobasidium torrendii FP15055 ss-10]|uniref:Uncharacterized protein n=1 Tax=Cylindrobasidium torrendii FP15055 ss-10 TaxID=1314674 RepID=A0A0D7B0P4_9AGAR|nr:hypothetical protein CYLTODRAFT_457820 [Cylindrobasidium torrendii FP15055 ss-10]
MDMDSISIHTTDDEEEPIPVPHPRQTYPSVDDPSGTPSQTPLSADLEPGYATGHERDSLLPQIIDVERAAIVEQHWKTSGSEATPGEAILLLTENVVDTYQTKQEEQDTFDLPQMPGGWPLDDTVYGPPPVHNDPDAPSSISQWFSKTFLGGVKPGEKYDDLAVKELCINFPDFRKDLLKKEFTECGKSYAKAYTSVRNRVDSLGEASGRTLSRRRASNQYSGPEQTDDFLENEIRSVRSMYPDGTIVKRCRCGRFGTGSSRACVHKLVGEDGGLGGSRNRPKTGAAKVRGTWGFCFDFVGRLSATISWFSR